MFWKLIRSARMLIALVLIGLLLAFCNPFCGSDDDTAEESTTPTTSAPVRPTLTAPPARPDMSEELPPPTTTAPAVSGEDPSWACRVVVLPDEYLTQVTASASRAVDVTAKWDAREIGFSETREAMEEWLASTVELLDDPPNVPSAGLDETEDWLAELSAGAEDIWEWLIASGRGSTVKRREAVEAFAATANQAPYIVSRC